jgi:hypothetical protein
VSGLVGGAFVALAWLAASGFTFLNMIARVWPAWAIPLLFLVVPAVVGVVGTLHGGNAAAGRRTARLAGLSAGLVVYLYATLSVAVIGTGGPPDDNLTTVSAIVDDRLGNNVIFYLMLLPLVTATFGWSAAAMTARVWPRVVNADGEQFASAAGESATMPAPGSAAPMTRQHRPVRLALECAAVVAAVLLAAATFLAV